MHVVNGIRQRELRRITCQWGSHTERHATLIPFFRQDYKVFGLVGFSLDAAPVWYPGIPVHWERGLCRYKDFDSDLPPHLSTLAPDHFDGAFYHERTLTLPAAFAPLEQAPGLDGAINLAARKFQGWTVRDILFEAPLHRVKGLVLGRRFFRTRTLSVLQVSDLAAGLGPAKTPPPPAIPPLHPGTTVLGLLVPSKLKRLVSLPPDPPDEDK